MRSAAALREDIQKRLEMVRQEREREQRAFDELALQYQDMTPAELCEAARKKALEEEPKSLTVGDTVVSVGDYVQTIEDVRVFLAAEKGIFVPDPVKEVYLGERAKVIRVWPSFQGREAVELLFADGAAKVFLTECLTLWRNTKKPQAISFPHGEKTAGVDLKQQVCVPEFVSSTNSESVLQLTHNSISGRADNVKLNKKKQEIQTVPAFLTRSVIMKKNDKIPVKLDEAEHQKNYLATIEDSQQGFLTTQKGPRNGGVCVNSDQSIGLVKEVLSGRRRCASVGEQLGSPLALNAVSTTPLASFEEPDDLLMTPRVDLISYKRPPVSAEALILDASDNAIPTSCPTDYKARFSLSDTTTRIPRLENIPAPSNTEGYIVAGAHPDKTELKFCPVVFQKENNTLEAILSAVTRELGWHLEGLEAKRLFTTDGREITHVNDIQDSKSFVVTPGHTYCVEQTPTTTPLAGRPEKTKAITRTPTAKTTETSATSDALAEGTVKVRQFFGDSSAASATVSEKNKKRHHLSRPTPSFPSQPAPSSGLASTRGAQPPVASRVAGKGILKPISVRVFANGEYGDNKTDRLPFRTVTLRPIHKTMRAIVNTIERELDWNVLGKKVDKLYDALGVEIVSLDGFVDGQAIVVSEGDRFVTPHPSTVLYHDAVRLLAKTDVLFDLDR